MNNNISELVRIFNVSFRCLQVKFVDFFYNSLWKSYIILRSVIPSDFVLAVQT